MKMRIGAVTLSAAALVLVGATPFMPAAAEEECVRLVGTGTSGELQTMDPAFNYSTDVTYNLMAIYEPLVELDNSFQPVPRLAESWEANEDGTQWTFHLRKGVKFHDGSDFDAGDVVYTFRRLIDPELASAAAAVLGVLTPDGIEAVDKHTVRFTTAEPTVELPILLRTKFSLIVPEGATAEDLKHHGVGTGPFVQEEFTVGKPVSVLRRNPNYWVPGLPKAECLRITVSLEQVSRAAAMLAGETDLLLEVDPVMIVQFEENPNVDVVSTPGASLLSLDMWIDTPPFDDLRVRQAFKLVVDRQAVVDTVLLGFGALGNDNPVPPSSTWAYTHDVLERDVEKAKQLLAEAGYPDGLDVDLYTSDGFPGMLLFAQAYKEMAADAGIDVNLINTPADSFWDDIWMKRSFHSDAWIARAPLAALSIAYRKEAKWNMSHWYRDDFDALLDEAGRTIDPEERKRLIQEAQRLLAEEGGVIIPVFSTATSALRHGCTGFKPHVSSGAIYDFRSLECK